MGSAFKLARSYAAQQMRTAQSGGPAKTFCSRDDMTMAEEAPKSVGITLGQLGASGRLVIVQCAICANRRHCRPMDLDLPMETTVSEAGLC